MIRPIHFVFLSCCANFGQINGCLATKTFFSVAWLPSSLYPERKTERKTGKVRILAILIIIHNLSELIESELVGYLG